MTVAKFAMPKDWKGDNHKAGRISSPGRTVRPRSFGAAVVAIKEPTELEKRRLCQIAALRTSIDPKSLRVALQRVIVLERVSEATLQDEVGSRLRKQFYVPIDNIPDEASRLRQAIKSAKSNRLDAFPLLRSVLADVAGARLASDYYVRRHDEDHWLESLSKDRAFLSGRPRTGKSKRPVLLLQNAIARL